MVMQAQESFINKNNKVFSKTPTSMLLHIQHTFWYHFHAKQLVGQTAKNNKFVRQKLDYTNFTFIQCYATNYAP